MPVFSGQRKWKSVFTCDESVNAYLSSEIEPEDPNVNPRVYPTAQQFNSAHKCLLYYGDPTTFGSRVEDATRLNNANPYTMIPDWQWKDEALGPFLLATMGTFIATIIKYRDDTGAPAFALAVLGAALWVTGFLLQMCSIVEFRSTAKARVDIAARSFAYCIAIISVVLAGLIGTSTNK